MKMPSSKAEIKIIRELLKKDGVTRTHLITTLHINSQYLKRYLARLRSEGIVTLQVDGQTTRVYLNTESPKYEAVKTLWGDVHERKNS